MSEKPIAVYKYLIHERALDVLGKLMIRFSQASVLNDALEFKPPVKGMGSPELIEAGLLEKLHQKQSEVVQKVYSSLPEAEANKLIKGVLSDFAEVVASPEYLAKSVAEVYERLDKNFGVLSLSERPDSALMWSHYADGGRGCILEFDAAHPWFWAKREEADSFRHLRRVDYRDCEPTNFIGMSDQVALYTKSVAWAYEGEWRIIRNFNDAAYKRGPDLYGNDVLLFPVPPECIRSVILGYKMTPDNVQSVQEMVADNPALSHVNLQRAVLTFPCSIGFAPLS